MSKPRGTWGVYQIRGAGCQLLTSCSRYFDAISDADMGPGDLRVARTRELGRGRCCSDCGLCRLSE